MNSCHHPLSCSDHACKLRMEDDGRSHNYCLCYNVVCKKEERLPPVKDFHIVRDCSLFLPKSHAKSRSRAHGLDGVFLFLLGCWNPSLWHRLSLFPHPVEEQRRGRGLVERSQIRPCVPETFSCLTTPVRLSLFASSCLTLIHWWQSPSFESSLAARVAAAPPSCWRWRWASCFCSSFLVKVIVHHPSQNEVPSGLTSSYMILFLLFELPEAQSSQTCSSGTWAMADKISSRWVSMLRWLSPFSSIRKRSLASNTASRTSLT